MDRILKVFLIEDSVKIKAALTRIIEMNEGLKVIGTTDSATEAIQFIQTIEMDALIIDLNLRQGSGLDVLSYLQKNGNPTSILRIVFTSHASPAFRHACTSLGAEYIFDKSQEFIKAIEVLKEHRITALG